MQQRSIIGRILYNCHPAHVKNRKMYYLWIGWVIFHVILFLIPKEAVVNSGLILLPILGMFIYAMVSRDVFQGLAFGTFSMYLLYYKTKAPWGFVDAIGETLSDTENLNTMLAFLFCGVTIVALEESGATKCFGNYIAAKMKNSRKKGLLMTGIFSGALSVDDYLGALTVGTAMRPITDALKIPREATAFMIRSCCSSISMLYAMGDWGYFVILQLVALKLVDSTKEAASTYTTYIPFLFYPFVSIIIAVLFALGIVPKVGKMKEAWLRVEKTGELGGSAPEALEDEDDLEDNKDLTADGKAEMQDGDDNEENQGDISKENVGIWNFILPIVITFIAMIVTDFDGLRAGALVTAGIGILYVAQGIFTLEKYFEVIIAGFQDMIDMVMILLFGYMMGDIMAEMQFGEYITEIAGNIGNPGLFPVMVFVLFCISEYLCSLNWSLYVIALPILFQVAPAIGANLTLTVAALLSAGLFGSNACFFSDGGIIVAKGCRLKPFEHGFSCLPYYIAAAVISAMLYLIVGLVMM